MGQVEVKSRARPPRSGSASNDLHVGQGSGGSFREEQETPVQVGQGVVMSRDLGGRFSWRQVAARKVPLPGSGPGTMSIAGFSDSSRARRKSSMTHGAVSPLVSHP